MADNKSPLKKKPGKKVTTRKNVTKHHCAYYCSKFMTDHLPQETFGSLYPILREPYVHQPNTHPLTSRRFLYDGIYLTPDICHVCYFCQNRIDSQGPFYVAEQPQSRHRCTLMCTNCQHLYQKYSV